MRLELESPIVVQTVFSVSLFSSENPKVDMVEVERSYQS